MTVGLLKSKQKLTKYSKTLFKFKAKNQLGETQLIKIIAYQYIVDCHALAMRHTHD